MELRNEEERRFWSLKIPEAERVELILRYRQDQEEDKQRAIKRGEDARILGL